MIRNYMGQNEKRGNVDRDHSKERRNHVGLLGTHVMMGSAMGVRPAGKTDANEQINWDNEELEPSHEFQKYRDSTNDVVNGGPKIAPPPQDATGQIPELLDTGSKNIPSW